MKRLVEARYYKVIKNGVVQCEICPNYCQIAENRLGRCLGRQNIGGKLYAINYGEVVSYAIDPIEKKPLYHFYPGSEIFSIATYGCNFLCPFCQNWEISQNVQPTYYISPQRLIELTIRNHCSFIAYTYTEPLVWFEYLLDAARLAEEKGIKNVLVTNGMINPEPLEELLPFVSAMNIDLKSIKEEFYSDFIKGDLNTVKNTIIRAKKKCHIEITNLIIPTKNDRREEIEELVDFVASVGVNTPLHFSRYLPHYKLTIPPTPTETLKMAYAIAKKKLYYVYIGNVPDFALGNDTICPNCHNILIRRAYFSARIIGIEDKKCKECGREVDVVMDEPCHKH